MPDQPSSALVTTKKSCPLCESKSRSQIDLLISELLSHEQETVDTESGEVTIVEVEGKTFTEIESSLRRLLVQLGDTNTEFQLADLIAHATEHTLVTKIAGLRVRSEGNMLFVGDQAFQRVDPKDALAVGITYGLQLMLEGKMKITAAAWTNMQALLWRMMGNAGADEFIQAMIDKTTKAGVNPESPLGTAYEQHQIAVAKKQARIEQEEREVESELEEQETTEETVEETDA